MQLAVSFKKMKKKKKREKSRRNTNLNSRVIIPRGNPLVASYSSGLYVVRVILHVGVCMVFISSASEDCTAELPRFIGTP